MTTREDSPHGAPTPDEPQRDEWLSAALRHAPDANAAPPADLSAAILREARQAVRTTSTARSTQPANSFIRWWSWLARPPIAAGFATVMVATVVGLMWWERPLDETLPSRAEAPSSLTADAPAIATTPTAPGASSSAIPAPETGREAARSDAAPTAPAPDAAKKPDARAPRAAPRQRAAEPAPTRVPAAPSALAKSGRSTAADESAAAPPPAAATARLAARRDAERGPLPVIAEPEQWTWQRSAGPRPMTAALQSWLAQLERNARWQVATTTPPATAASLALARDGAPNATLALSDDAVWLTRPGAPTLMARLAPAAAAALKTALDAAAP